MKMALAVGTRRSTKMNGGVKCNCGRVALVRASIFASALQVAYEFTIQFRCLRAGVLTMAGTILHKALSPTMFTYRC